MASNEWKKLSLSQENISNLSATDTNELIINEDSDNDMILKISKKLTMTYLVMEQKVI